MDQALDIRAERPDSLAARVASLVRSPFVRRSVGVMAIGLVNFLVLAGLGALLFALLQLRTPRALWRVESVDSAMSAMLMAFAVLFGAFMVLFAQSLLRRIVAGIVVFFFLVIAITCPGVELALKFEHLIVFWVGVLMFIPLRAIGSWSLHWSDQVPGRVGTGQFSLADLLSWTTAIAATIGFFRVLPAPRLPMVFTITLVAFWNPAGVIAMYSAAVAAVFIVAGPCLWLAASRRSRVRGSLRITVWILAVSILWGVAILYLDYVYRWTPWWQVILFACESLLYLLALEVTLLANLFALEWLGLRWTRSLPRAR